MIPAFIYQTDDITWVDYPGYLARCYFCREYYQVQDYALAGVALPLSVSVAVSKRQAEYLAGRYLARRIFLQAGREYRDIASGEDRQPLWPVGVIGSLSHNDNTALCAISFSPDIHATGVDVETIMRARTAEDLTAAIVNKREAGYLRSLAHDFPFLLTLAFSAKESLFKALYPFVKKYVSFLDATLLDMDESQGCFSLVLNRTLQEDFPQGRRFRGYYWFDFQSVTTLIFF